MVARTRASLRQEADDRDEQRRRIEILLDWEEGDNIEPITIEGRGVE